jgi:hypothetical protein
VPLGTEVTLEARPSQLYQFVGWTGIQNANQNPVTINATSPGSIHAVFRLNYVEVVAIPAVLAGSGLAIFIARRPLAGLARGWLDNFREKKRFDED